MNPADPRDREEPASAQAPDSGDEPDLSDGSTPGSRDAVDGGPVFADAAEADEDGPGDAEPVFTDVGHAAYGGHDGPDHFADTGDGEAERAVVHCQHVSRWYGDVIAVNDLNLAIGPGITGLLGPNGAGKSTFLKMVMGLIRPSHGTVRVLGQQPWNNPELLDRIGYVPEAPAPWRDLSGREAALRAAHLADVADAETRVDAALRRVGLDHAADKTVRAYSHGMQQRLKFAMALINDPELLVLDEPLLGTDPVARRDLIRLLRSLAEEGRSILISTHVLTDIELLTDSIMLLNHGRLMAHGDVHHIRDLLDRYPRTIRVATPEPERVGRRVWEMEGVLGIERDAGGITIRTDRPGEFFPAIQALLATGELPFTALTSPDDNVEAVFRYLVGP